MLITVPTHVGIGVIFPIVLIRWMFLLNLNKRKEYFFHLKKKNNDGKVITVSKMKFYVKVINYLTKWYSSIFFITIPSSIYVFIGTMILLIFIFIDGN
jgi:hypothetical protein